MNQEWIPRMYQREAIKFLLERQHGGLFLDMGLGKTSITLAVIKILHSGGHIKKVLLVSPIRTLYTTWPDEIRKWSNFNSLEYWNMHEFRDSPPPAKALIHGINPESFLKLLRNGTIAKMGFDMLVVDESSLFKNPASFRFKELKKILHLFKRRIILTGTPAPNGLQDLWSQMFIIDRGESLEKYITHFRNKYCSPNWEGYGYFVNEFAAKAIYQAIAPKVKRLEAGDHIDMPELVVNHVPVRLPTEARRYYNKMMDEFLIVLKEHTIYSANAAVAGARCRQIANGGIYTSDGGTLHIHDAKTDALKEIIEGLGGKPVLIFYEFKHDVERILRAIGEDTPNLTASKRPEELVRDFNSGKIPVMIGHPQTIGLGLNLQGSCHHVVWMGVPWDLGLLSQANARVWRQGQESDRVFIHYIMAEDTLDEKVYHAIEKKSATQQKMFDAIQELAK